LATAAPPVEESWNPNDIYTDDAAFRAARDEFEAGIDSFGRFEGRLGESAAMLADALEELTDAFRCFVRLRCYATLKSDADTRDPRYQAMRQEVELLATDLSGRVAYLRPEILALEPALVEKFLIEEKRLAPHAFYLRDLMRQRRHVLGPAEERIVAAAGLVTRAPSALYNVLHNVDLPRKEVELSTGEKVRLTPVEFHRHRATSVRADRAELFTAFFQAYSDFGDTLGQNLYSNLKTHMFRARVRRYDSCLSASLDGDRVPLTVYRNLIRRVRERLPTLHRYFGLRARALGLERLDYTDLHCSLAGASRRTYDTREAQELILSSTAPLGAEYSATLRRSFVERWIDWHPRPGKRAGAYASGWAYDVHPYVLLNYTGDFESVSTLAHEMGHALHSYFSNRTQPFATADYSIFVAEVASTLNEALLAERVYKDAESDDERLILLGSYLDGLRGTLFRQTMFAEFELQIHERAERGEVLTSERLDEIYLGLLRSYHGHDDGIVHVGEEYAVEWAAVPHFYYDFYVYQYATGIVAATALAHAILDGVAGAADRYLEFLRSGGSDYPLELLRRADVDLESSEPYDALHGHLEDRLDRLERLLVAGAGN